MSPAASGDLCSCETRGCGCCEFKRLDKGRARDGPPLPQAHKLPLCKRTTSVMSVLRGFMREKYRLPVTHERPWPGRWSWLGTSHPTGRTETGARNTLVPMISITCFKHSVCVTPFLGVPFNTGYLGCSLVLMNGRHHALST